MEWKNLFGQPFDLMAKGLSSVNWLPLEDSAPCAIADILEGVLDSALAPGRPPAHSPLLLVAAHKRAPLESSIPPPNLPEK